MNERACSRDTAIGRGEVWLANCLFRQRQVRRSECNSVALLWKPATASIRQRQGPPISRPQIGWQMLAPMARRIAFGFWSIAQNPYGARILFGARISSPFLQASESPMAMTCFRFLTRPPLPALPERNVPCLLRRIALLTDFPTALPYLGIVASMADPQITPKRYRDDVRSAMVTACKLRPKGRHQIHGSSLHDVPHCNRTHSQ